MRSPRVNIFVRQRSLAVCVRIAAFLPGVPQRNVAATGLLWMTRSVQKRKHLQARCIFWLVAALCTKVAQTAVCHVFSVSQRHRQVSAF